MIVNARMDRDDPLAVGACGSWNGGKFDLLLGGVTVTLSRAQCMELVVQTMEALDAPRDAVQAAFRAAGGER